ncbi:hypothetical protein ACJRO7_015286 [Eucalyptus globulus]|uniref:Uncharacterized protein n=1 Tax=Eucalyptus globulus TaxID=34317 RepID=A0ABD3L329_EUCGL
MARSESYNWTILENQRRQRGLSFGLATGIAGSAADSSLAAGREPPSPDHRHPLAVQELLHHNRHEPAEHMVPRVQFVQLDPNQADKHWLGPCAQDPNSKSAASFRKSMSSDSQGYKLISRSTENASWGTIALYSFVGRDEFVSIAKHERKMEA